MRIYVASSWRNEIQLLIVGWLRSVGHTVYDFRNPNESDRGFSWADIDPEWQSWTPAECVEALCHPIAVKGFVNDKNALDWADCGVLVMPCGRSAHLEAGYLAGQGKVVHVILSDAEPELMYKLCAVIHPSVADFTTAFPTAAVDIQL